ncbi:MAG: hypothetical protein HPZ91_10200 [Lentisphaeria bacterium]|nr:hypothetical protein [Lentisphaeria bacterium]
MKKLLLCMILPGCVLCGLLHGAYAPLNRAELWNPIGATPVTVTRDAAENAIRFETARGNAGRCRIWPLFWFTQPGALKEAAAIRFEIKYLPENGEAATEGRIVLPKRKDGSGGTIDFKVPEPGKWKTVEVKFDRPPEEMASVRNLQIIVGSPADRMAVLVRNISLLRPDGKELEHQAAPAPGAAPAKDARHKLRPQGAPFSFAAAPGEKRVYRFTSDLLPDGEACGWTLTGLGGEESGIAGESAIREGKLAVELALPSGFYELRFPKLGQVFGISVLPPHTGAADSFFAIEGLMEGRSPGVYESCLALLVRHGILHNREWTNFAALNREENSYDDRNDRFYRAAGARGVKSIFAFRDFPGWTDRIMVGSRSVAPGKLVGVDSSIARMLDSRKAGLEGFHILNEYDLIDIPAEANLPSVKLAAWAARGREITLAGAAFCKGSTPSMRESIAGGMLDFIDVFCFHTYGEPEAMVPLVQAYRDDMKTHPKGQMPIWITESGKPWKRGLTRAVATAHGGPLNNLRPQVEEDLHSALWIVMKAVEAKACGIARYYPFVMQFFQENDNNFGMLDYYGTPLRSMHAYAFASNLLSGLEYRGDLKRNPDGLLPTRVFSDGSRAVAVFYAGKDVSGRRTVSLDGLPEGRGYGIDGAELGTDGGALSFRGGMAYWSFPADGLAPGMLTAETRPMKLLEAAKGYRPAERRHTPLIYRCDFRRSKAGLSSSGYHLPADGKLHFTVSNLSDRPVITRPRLTAPGDVGVTLPPPESLEIPPRSEAEFTVGVSFSGRPRNTIRIGDAQNELSATAVSLVDLSRLSPETRDFADPARWHHNSSGKQTARFNEEQRAIEVHTDFREQKSGDHWSFPEFRFKPEEKKKRLLAVSFDLRCDSRTGEKRPLFPLLMLARNGEPYESYRISAPQHEWKHYMIAVAESDVPYDLLRIGMGTINQDLVFLFRDVKLWFE